MDTKMEKNEIIRNFSEGINCSQQVVLQWAEKLGLDEETALRMAEPFGNGCMGGNICGCVTGALMMIGLEYGNCVPGDMNAKDQTAAKVAELRRKFLKKNGSLICNELIGYDVSKEEEKIKAFESGIIFERCPGYVNCALEILDEMIG